MNSKRYYPLPVLAGLLLFFGLFFEAQANIGIAKDANESGRIVQMDLYVENLHSTDTLSNIVITDDLDAVFGAGNYTITQAPEVVFGPNTLTLNGSYDGSTNTQITTGGSLLVGETVQVQFSIQITNPTDQGSGIGVYLNQASVSADDTTPNSFSDLSDDGTNPDPDGNNDPKDADEDDATQIDILQNPVIGVAKNATVNNLQVTLDFYLENFGNRTLSELSLVDDLDNVFGSGNYSISTAPQLIDDPGGITLNGSYNGGSDTEMISSGTLAIGDTAQIRMVVDVPGGGTFSNQATASAQSPLGKQSTDFSDNGTDPDPDGNGTPGGVGEGDPTEFVMGENAIIGVAKQASVNGSVITINLYLENLGNVTLDSLSLTDNLNTALGAGNFYISTAPSFIDDPGSLTLNSGFNGNSNTELLSSGTLAAGDTAQIQFQVTLLIIADLGSGIGNFENQAFASGQAPGGGLTQDSSDDGTDPDPNGNDNPNESGENDATAFSVSEISTIGIAKNYVSGGGSIVYYDFTLVNYGNTTISNLSVTEDLNAAYGSGNYIHTIDPYRVSGANTLNYNSAFNGNTNTSMLSGGSTLGPGEQVTFRIGHQVANVTDQGNGLGIYHNQVTVLGTDPDASPVSDVSHNGTNPDPNGNGDPTEGTEQDVTVVNINLTEKIGIAYTASVNVDLVTMDFYLENLGDTQLNEVSFLHDLDTLLGEGNYSIETAPFFVDDPGSMTLNTSYDGTSDKDMLVTTNSSLAVSDTAQIQMVVRVLKVANVGLGIGNYSSNVSVSAFSEIGGQVTDTSDDGTDPDPNGNNEANEAGENDATAFNLSVDGIIGVAQDIALSGFQVTVDVYLESLGTGGLTNVSLINNLDDTFGSGNYTIQTPPSLISDPGTLNLNTNYDGSSDTDLLLGTSTLNAGATAQIQFVVLITTESDQGHGYGVYANQSTASGQLASGVSVSDLSDDGTDPDPNGNNDPGDAGEDDINSFGLTGNPAIGISQKAYVNGTLVTLEFVIENLGDVTITNILLQNSLNPVFGSGKYSVTAQPTRVDGAETLTFSTNYFGFNVFTTMVGAGHLRPGESERFRVSINVTDVSDQGNGLGVYHNTVTVTGDGPDGSPVSDISDDGTNPDPNDNGNAGDAGEDDTTIITIGDEANLGAAKDVDVSNQQVTFDIYLENFASNTASSLSIIDDLDNVFGAGNYTINTSPALIDDPGTLNLNGSYDGSADTEILAAGSTLAAADTAQIRFIIDVTNIVDQGHGFSNYQNQAQVSGQSPLGAPTSDLSDFGTDPDPNANNFPNDSGEDDVTTFIVSPADSPIGAALNATVSGRQVTLDYYIENFGEKTLSDVSLVSDLDAIFGSGLYTIVSGPTRISSPRNLEVNTSYDGSTNTQLIAASSSIAKGVTEQIQLVVKVNELSDGGSGLGVYSHQFTVTGVNPSTSVTQDLSDSGTEPDPNSNGNPADAGEDDATDFTMPQVPEIGAAKSVSIDGRSVTIDIYIESFANTLLSNLSLTEDLDAVFGSGNYSITSAPAFIDDPTTINLEAGFDGSATTDIFAAGSTLAIGDTAQIRFTISVNNVTDQGSGSGIYNNQVTVSAQSPDATNGSDLSDSGTNPDPNDDSDPTGTGENDATTITLEGDIGDFVWNDLNGDGVQDVGESGISGITVFLDDNSNGTLDAGETSDTTDSSGAYQFTNLTPGNYTVDIDSTTVPTGFNLVTGNLPLSETLTAGEQANTADFGYQQQDATIGDFIWNDLDGDGVQDAGEPGLSGVTVYLDSNGNGTLDAGESSTSSNSSGAYDFTDLAAGSYIIEIDDSTVTTGFNLTTANLPINATIAAGEDYNAGDFGYQQQDASIGNFIWNDLNGNGAHDAGEPGLSGITVYLDYNSNASLDAGEPSTTTDSNGAYQFIGMPAGTYRVDVDATSVTTGFYLTTANLPYTEVLTAGEIATDADFGYQQQDATIGDFVWNDLNGDGVQDAGEPGLSGITVYLDANSNGALDGGETSTTTDANGAYDFTDLPTGTYRVDIDASTVTTGFNLVTANLPHDVNLAAGEDYNTGDFGYQQQDASIGDFVWNDLNGDGVQDAGESGISGITVYLDENSNGSFDGGEPSDVTDSSGAYQFTDLAAGSYSIAIDASSVTTGFNLTTANLPLPKNLTAGENYQDGDFGYQQQDASIGDYVWSDLNGDGVQDGGETGLSGIRVYLDLNNNDNFDSGEPSSTTDGSGAYQFIDMPAGTYVLNVDSSTLPTDFGLTTANLPFTENLTAGEVVTSADFGFQEKNASIGGIIWNDANGNGIQSGSAEIGLDGAVLDIYRDVNGDGLLDGGDTFLTSQTTAGGGLYDFTGLGMGDYLINVNNSGTLASRILTGGTNPSAQSLTVSQDLNDIDFGYRLQVSTGPIVTTHTVEGENFNTIVQVVGQILTEVGVAEKEDDTASGIQFPLGTVSFIVTSSVGGSVEVDINFSVAIPEENFFLYKVDEAGNSTLIPDHLWTQQANNSIQLQITDGGPFDLDGLENGIIVDPIAIGSATSDELVPFTFDSSENAPIDQWVSSRPATISGVTETTKLYVEGGLVSVDNGDYSAGPVSVGLGQKVRVMIRSSSLSQASKTATVEIGDYMTSYTVKTATNELNDLLQYGQACSEGAVKEVIKAYIAHYNRPAEVGGLNYWSCEVDQQNGNIDVVINNFIYTPEFTEMYDGLTDSEIVDKLYQQLFKRDPDVAGKEYWLEALDSGSVGYNHIAMALVNGTQGDDTELVNNKIEVAEYFAEQTGENGISALSILNILNNVTANPATVEAAKQRIDDYVLHVLGLQETN